jgi:uncharacterized membrane protein
METDVLIKNDAVVIGVLMAIIWCIFELNRLKTPSVQFFFKFIPPILLVYFIPGVLNSLGIISGKDSAVYPFISKYLLPVCLFFFTISLDFKAIKTLGLKALLVFLFGTIGVILGGPIALYLVSSWQPELLLRHPDLYKGLGTIAGSWIGGGANQTALKEILQPNPDLFSKMVAVDVLIAEIWLAVLLWGVGRHSSIDKKLKADPALMHEIFSKSREFQLQQKAPGFLDYFRLLGLAFVALAVSHWFSDILSPFFKENYPFLEKFSFGSSFFWVISIITILGIGASFTKARNWEAYGASTLGSVLLYILIASIGMQMNVGEALSEPLLFLIGLIWMSIHIFLIVLVSRWLKVPFFVLSVGSQANIGGAASASIVAGAFSASLVPIGVIFAVLGYAIGTYGGYLSAMLMLWVQGLF